MTRPLTASAVAARAGDSPVLGAALWYERVTQETELTQPTAAVELHGALVERLRGGDAAALEMLYRQHHEAVRAFARRLLGDHELAEDLVHDVFVNVTSVIRSYRGESSLRTFLISVAVNKSKHFVRSAIRRRGMLARLAAEPPRSTAAAPPDEAWERRELAAELQRALDRLPLDERIAVILCEVEERTSTEVAAIVQAPEATVRTRLSRAKKRLRAMLGGEP
jgi:RNA polymerase sigma-70 factor (ECF subfamily)